MCVRASSSPILIQVSSCSASPSPLQIISQGQVKAESITPDLGVQIKQVLLLELAAFLRRWVCACCAWGGAGLVPEPLLSEPPALPCVPCGYPS